MRGQPPARKVETRAPASAKLTAQRALLEDPVRAIAAAQSAYYLGIGVWPLAHLRSFAWVTGPKPEGWLAKAVGACLANVGWTLGHAALAGGRNRRNVPSEVRSLGLRFAITFAAFDLFYAGIRRRISPVYLLNGIAQLGFAAAWIGTLAWEKRERRHAPFPAHA